MDEVQKPNYFEAKKWLTAVLSIANIVLMILYAALATFLANRYIHEFEDIKPYEAETTKVSIHFWIVKFFSTYVIAGFRDYHHWSHFNHIDRIHTTRPIRVIRWTY